MYKQSNEAKLAYQSAERTLDIVVNVNGVDYKATDIEQFDYDSGGYTGDTFSIGSTYENNITVKFIHLVEGLKRGMIVKPRIGIKLPNGTFEYTPLGVFIIADEIQMDRNNNSTTIKAYDKFVVMEGQYVSKLTYPANAVDIITEIAQMCKVDVNTNDLAHLPTIKVSKAITKQSYRTAIGWIAQLYVGFASFDRDGKLTIRRVAEPNYTIEPSEYEQQGLVKNEAPYIIGGISCNVNIVETTNNGETNETTHKIHSGSVNGSQIELTNDIMTQELLDSIWNSLKTVTFYPFSLNWFGNPAIEAGDWLSLKDMKGNVFVVPNNGYTISFNGGLSSTSKADQNATDSSTVKYTGELTRAIENYSRRQAPDGTNIYTDVKEPTDAKFNDVWFKPNGNSTELWIFERQSDGTGKWVKQPVNGEVEQKINDALKDFDELDKSFKDNANTQSATNELMKSQIDSISNQIPNLSDEISRVNGSVTSLKTQTDKDRQQLQTTSQNLDQARQDLLSNSNRLDKLSTQTDKDRQQLQTTSQNLDKARQDVLSNSSRIDKLSVGLDSVNINVNNVNSKVEGIQIGGGKNIVRGTSSDWTGVGRDEFNGSNNQTHIIGYAYLDQLKVGDSVTVTCNYQYSGVTNANAEVQIQGWGNVTKWESGQFPRQTPFAMQTGNDLYKGSINYTFKLTADMLKNRYWELAWRFNYVNQGAWFQWVFFKMEKGTTATPWTPAPEDEIERVSQLRVDLDGMNATVATNKGDIAQIKLTENGMQQSIKDAQGNISTLQNDSKQFKQQFQDVNGNITTIKNDAKSLSSQLSTKVGTSEYNSFKNQTAQELRTKLTASDLNGYAKSADVKVSVDGLNARFDNLNVGGTNLLRKTSNEWKTWTGTGWASDVVDAGSINLDAGTYTFRVEIDNTGNTQRRVHAEAYVFSESRFLDQIAKSYTQTFVNARSKGYATITFTIDKPLTDVRIHPHTAADSPITSTVTIKWRREKLEKGNVSTDWSPAPEDTDNKIEVLSGKIAANSNEFSTVYTKITNVQDVVNSDGGGINLAKHTSNKLANVTASPWLYVGSESSSSFNNLKDYQGKYMTVRVWIEKPSRDTWVQIWNDKQPIYGNKIKAGQSGYSTASGIIPKGITAWNIPVGNNINGTTTTFGWKEFKIELGNVATPWSPNPDDIDSDINTAANNARTNAKNDAINAIKGDSQWQSMGKIVTNASFLQNSDGFAQEVSKRIVGSVGQTNLYYNSEFTYSGNDNHNVDGIISTGNIAYSVNGLYGNYRGSNSMCEHTTGGMTDYKYIEHTKDKYVKVAPGEIISGSVTVWTTGDSSVPRDGYAICTISFYKDLNSSRMGYKETSVAAKDIAYPNYKTLKVENVTVPSGANYMALHLIVRGAADWHFSQPMLVKDNHVGVYVPSTQLQLNQVIDTADSHTRTISDYLTGSNSRFVQMANYLNMNVGNSSVSVNGNGVMLSGNRIKITGKTLIDNAVILDALIKDINANTIKTKKLDASKINVTNLNANNITSGTISGTNLNINLDSGDVSFQKGVLYNNKNLKIDLTNGFLEIQDTKKTRGLLITDGNIFISKDLSSIDPSKQIANIGYNDGSGMDLDVYNVGKMSFTYSEIVDKSNNVSLETRPVNWRSKDYLGPQLYMKAGEYKNTHTFAIRTNGDGLGASILGDNDKITITASEVSISKIKNTYIENLDATNLHVYGSKNSVVPSSKGYVAINAYETAEYYFGDIGESQTDKQGVKIINLEPLFLETVNTSVPYQVFLSSYDDAKVWVFARNNNMFIVKSDKPNVKFAWEIKAKRKDYENVRLETVDLKNERN